MIDRIAVVELCIFPVVGLEPGRGVVETDATLPLAYADLPQTMVRSN